jgi:hypothetical protein
VPKIDLSPLGLSQTKSQSDLLEVVAEIPKSVLGNFVKNSSHSKT